MDIRLFDGNIEDLRPIAESWYQDTKDNTFGIDIDVDSHLEDLKKMAANISSTLLALYDGDIPVGYMGIKTFISPLSNQKIANEHYWYVLPDKRNIGSARMIKTAKMWAKLNGCSHIIFNASNLASDMHDKVCEFYEKTGCKKFETSFIQEIR